jgi:hypothetical protein
MAAQAITVFICVNGIETITNCNWQSAAGAVH